MLSKIEKEEMKELKISFNRILAEKQTLEKELEVLKEETKKQLKEMTSRVNFVEGLLSHMLAKPIKITHPDGAVEQKWQEVRVISGENIYQPRRRL